MAMRAFEDFFEVSVRNENKLKPFTENNHCSLVIISQRRKDLFESLLMAHHPELHDHDNLEARAQVAYLCSYFHPTGLRILFEKGYYGSEADLNRTRTQNHPIMNETMTQFGNILREAFKVHSDTLSKSELITPTLKSVCTDFLSLIKYLKKNFPDFLKTKDEYGKYPHQQLDIYYSNDIELEYHDFAQKIQDQASQPAQIQDLENQIKDIEYRLQTCKIILNKASNEFQTGRRLFQYQKNYQILEVTYSEYVKAYDQKIKKLKKKKVELEEAIYKVQ